MYFPDDPLFPLDPIFNSIPDPKVRERLISRYDHTETVPEWALGVPVGHRPRERWSHAAGERGRRRVTSPRTPSQTIGPFFAIGLAVAGRAVRGPRGHAGRDLDPRSVLDGDGAPMPDAMVETWQADPDGRFDHPDDPRGAVAGFRGFGRSSADADGRYGILTMKPGVVPATRTDRPQAPHIDVSVFARGLLKRVVTRIYFADEPDPNASDPVLSQVSDAGRRSTLIADRPTTGTGSTSVSRGNVKPSSSQSEPAQSGLFDGVLARGDVRDEVERRAWLQAMLDVEAALARAAASCRDDGSRRERSRSRGRARRRELRLEAIGRDGGAEREPGRAARSTRSRSAGGPGRRRPRCISARRVRTSSTPRRCWWSSERSRPLARRSRAPPRRRPP